ncbi:long-chain acyl-CoA synthetase [Amycolatopsis marina]|uniref:Long-chain acyl-CoA synthetase n=1 Tax=Amycolatopsis marina TaxID=490629 RepID=A0A1I1A8U5_9PSEU|nr:AMP-binding protein [Amycolatopsis marina]SFB34375.1 long-chain acyl-CoA synthetase [Amycolatopsis marina]
MTITSPPSPPGLPSSLTYPDAPVGSLLASGAAHFGSRPAYVHGDRALTFADVGTAAARFANALAAHGIGRGDTVALHLPNCLAYPVAYFGTMLAGATFTPANPLLPPKDLAAQLVDSNATAAVTFGPVAAALDGVREHTNLRLVIVDRPIGDLGPGQVEFQTFHAEAPPDPPEVGLDPATDLAHLAYTGGTTGRSKGVRLPHRNVVVNALQAACWGSGAVPALDVDGNPRLDQIGSPEEWPVRLGTGIGINLTPWFHAMGTIGSLIIPMLTGGTVVLHDRFDPVHYAADAERRGVTTLGGAPALFAALLACPEFHTRDLSSVRAVSSGAAPMPMEMFRALTNRLPNAVISEGYGLTEVTMAAVLSPTWHSGTRKVGSVGLPVFDTEVKVVPVEGGDPLPRGAHGEICLRGPQVMTGYHQRPEETAAALDDGWLHTGDIGVIDEDGYLSVVDRKKDMLLYKGYNVYPRELEELLVAQPSVLTAAVVGKPSADVGELPVAFVVRAEGHEETGEAELMESVNSQVLPYKRLRELRFVEQIPVSAAGKILKRELRAQLGPPPGQSAPA